MIFAFILHMIIDHFTVVDFADPQNRGKWQIVNDGVMGGLSEGRLYLAEEGHAVFTGTVSLANNGGFTSIRGTIPRIDVSRFKTIMLEVKGDQKDYQLRVKDKRSTWYTYSHTFSTSGEWEQIAIPFEELVPVFRGRKLNGNPFQGNQMEEIGFLIANKQNETFEFQVRSIVLVP
ncbi:MAG: CIA30 family protein [Cyclobacteriaceae bacterium]